MRNYQAFYEKLTTPLRQRPFLITLLRAMNSLITKVMYVLYPLLLIALYLKDYQFQFVFPYIIIPGISFILLSFVRKKINYPRPYETWAIEPLINRSEKGNSFPSRHVFSATMISMCYLSTTWWLGSLLLFFSMVLAFCRFIGGVHYPKDVIAGIVIGILSGSLLFLF